jgi:hypothetical protein
MQRKIEPLTAAHRVDNFTCGDRWLDNYLQKMAILNQKTGYGRSYVAVPADGSSMQPHTLDAWVWQLSIKDRGWAACC